MSRLLRRLGASCALLALAAISCRDQSLTGPGLPRHTAIKLAPRFAVGVESARPIDGIRATVWEVDAQGAKLEQAPLLVKDTAVSPQSTSWPVTLDLVTSGSLRVIVELELLHVEPNPEVPLVSTEWAARVGPITVTPGSTTREQNVLLGRGPLPNLDITDVSIGEFPSTIYLGDGASLFGCARLRM